MAAAAGGDGAPALEQTLASIFLGSFEPAGKKVKKREPLAAVLSALKPQGAPPSVPPEGR